MTTNTLPAVGTRVRTVLGGTYTFNEDGTWTISNELGESISWDAAMAAMGLDGIPGMAERLQELLNEVATGQRYGDGQLWLVPATSAPVGTKVRNADFGYVFTKVDETGWQHSLDGSTHHPSEGGFYEETISYLERVAAGDQPVGDDLVRFELVEVGS